MTEVQTTIRLPAELIKRADELVPMLEARPDLAAWQRVNRSTVLRLALARGLEALGRDLQTGGK